MSGNRRILIAMLVLLALSGAALILLAGVGDAGVMAGTAVIAVAIDNSAQADNRDLRDTVYATITRLQAPWAMVSLIGFVVLGASVFAMIAAWLERR